MRVQSKRLSILSQPKAQEVYSVPMLNARDREHFFTFSDDELDAVKGMHSHRHRIHFLLMLGYFNFKPVCLSFQWKDIASDYQYIAELFYPGASLQKQNISRFTRSRFYRRIFDMLDYQRCTKDLEQELLTKLLKCAAYYIDEAQLFHSAIRFLQSRQIAIPRYSTLQDLISKAINTEETRLAKIIDKKLSSPDEFLSLLDDSNKPVQLNVLKKLPRTCRPGEYKQEISRHQLLSPLSMKAYRLIKQLRLTEGNIRYFATRCQQYDIRDLRALKTEKALLHLVCFVATRFRISNDSLTLSFLVAYKALDEKAKIYRDECAKQQALSIAGAIEQVPQVLNLFIDDNITNSVDFGGVRDNAFDIISKDQLRLICEKLSAMKPGKAHFKWEYVDVHFQQVITNIRPLLKVLDFGCRNNAVLHRQIIKTKSALLSKDTVPVVDGRLIKRHDKNTSKPMMCPTCQI